MRALRAVVLVGATAVATLMIALGGATAHAKATVQGQLAASLGYTDNVLNAPVTANPVGDGFAEIRPSITLTTGTPRAVQRLSYTLTGNLYFTRTEANSYTNRLEWAGLFLPSRRSDLALAVSLSQGRLNTFNFGQITEVAPGAVRIAGSQTYVAAALREAMTYELTPAWRLTQGVAFNALFVVDTPRTTPNTVTTDATLGADRVFRSDSVGMELRLGYLGFLDPPTTDPMTGATTPGGTRNGMLNTLTARWRHDFSRAWNVEAQLGVVEANRFDSTNLIWQPYAFAAARVSDAWANGELAYTHTVTPSALAGTLFTIDGVTLRGTFLLGQRTGLTFTAGGGYQFARQGLFETGVETGQAHVGLVDSALTWAPIREVQLFARYNYFVQKPVEMVAPAAGGLPELSRHTVLIGIGAIYPADPGLVVPRVPNRVDRTDSEGIPAPHRSDDRDRQ